MFFVQWHFQGKFKKIEVNDRKAGKALQCLFVKFILLFLFSDEDFQQLQQSFMEKHYLEFEDSDENKLSYTSIFNEYVSFWEPSPV